MTEESGMEITFTHAQSKGAKHANTYANCEIIIISALAQ